MPGPSSSTAIQTWSPWAATRMPDPLRVADRVLDQIGQAAAHRDRPQRQRDRALELDLDGRPAGARALRDLVQQSAEIGRDDRLLALAAGEREIAVDDVDHLVDVGAQTVEVAALRPAIGEHLELEPHPGERRPEIVRDRRQQLGALADVAMDALAHQVEGRARPADLGRAGELEVADVAALAELIDRPGEPQGSAAPGGS